MLRARASDTAQRAVQSFHDDGSRLLRRQTEGRNGLSWAAMPLRSDLRRWDFAVDDAAPEAAIARMTAVALADGRGELSEGNFVFRLHKRDLSGRGRQYCRIKGPRSRKS